MEYAQGDGQAQAVTGVAVADIPTAITPEEIYALCELAKGKVVLELGAFYGYSAIAMSRVAKEMHSVDAMVGDEAVGYGDFAPIYFGNLKANDTKVITHVGYFAEVLPSLRRHYFDGIFIDGAHDADSVAQDTELSLPLLKKGGWLAWHDYGRFPAVTAVADTFGIVEQTGHLGVAWPQA